MKQQSLRHLHSLIILLVRLVSFNGVHYFHYKKKAPKAFLFNNFINAVQNSYGSLPLLTDPHFVNGELLLGFQQNLFLSVSRNTVECMF